MIATVVLFCSLHLSHAQETDYVREMEENYAQLRQKPGSEEALKKLLDGVSLSADTIYAVVFEPALCPRCEAKIPNFYEMLKKVDQGKQFLLISCYKDRQMAEAYNRRNEFVADAYLYDMGSAVYDCLSFNTVSMVGVYFLKIIRSKGLVLTGGDAPMLNTEFVRQLVAHQQTMEQKVFPGDKKEETADMGRVFPSETKVWRGKAKDFELVTDGHHPSSIHGVPVFGNGLLMMNDQLENGILVYRQQGDKLRYAATLQPDSTEQEAFVETPKDDFRNRVRKHLVFFIPLAPHFMPDSLIGVSYSLPHLAPDTINYPGQNAIAYYNQAVVLRRNATTLAPEKMIAPEFNLWKDDYFYTHFNYCGFKDMVVMGCQKLTWPMEYEREEYEHITERNPFNPAFYDTSNPYIALFDANTGQLRGRIGQLEDCHRKSRTGYLFTDPVFCCSGNELLYGDGYSGKVHVTANPGHGEGTAYTVFDVDTATFAAVDTTLFYTEAYGSAYQRTFNRHITCVEMDSKRIDCLVAPVIYNEEAEGWERPTLWVTVDRKSGRRKERLLPKYGDRQALAFGLCRMDGKVAPFGLYRQGTDYKLRIFDATIKTDEICKKQ